MLRKFVASSMVALLKSSERKMSFEFLVQAEIGRSRQARLGLLRGLAEVSLLLIGSYHFSST